MAQEITIFINASFACALAALAAAVIAWIAGRPALHRAVSAALALSWLLLTAALALLWYKLGRAPLSNQYESLLSMIWFAAPLALWFHRRDPRPELPAAGALVSALGFGTAALLDKTMRPLMPALRSDWLIIHVLSSMAAYAAFALAAAAALRALAAKDSGTLAGLQLRLIKAGLAFLTLGITTGSVWAETAWGAWWSWDPKETWSLLTWLAYAAALHLRRTGLGDKRFSIITVACFALVLFTYFGVNFLLGGLHSYG